MFKILMWYLVLAFGSIQIAAKVLVAAQNLVKCSDPIYRSDSDVLRKFTLSKLNRTESLEVCMEFKEPLDQNYEITMELYKLTPGGNRKIPFVASISDPCNFFLKYFRDVWIKYMKCIGVKQPDKCPIPPGKYRGTCVINNLDALETLPHINGQFFIRSIVRNKVDKKIICCTESYHQQVIN